MLTEDDKKFLVKHLTDILERTDFADVQDVLDYLDNHPPQDEIDEVQTLVNAELVRRKAEGAIEFGLVPGIWGPF